MSKKDLISLFLLLIFAFVLYFYKLDKVPSGFYIDEAMPGYSAYSILKTGKDEYKKPFPIYFRFYGSYNPPLYTYLTALSVGLGGLTVFAVRAPAAFLGVLTVPIIFLLIKNLKITKSKYTPFITTLFFLISPWHFFYSRIGYEISLGFFLFCLGVLLFLLSLKRTILIIPTLLTFSLATYSSFSQKFIAPIFLIFAFIIFRKKIFEKKSFVYFIAGISLFLLTQIPNLKLINTPAFFPKSDLFFSETLVNKSLATTKILPYSIRLLLSFIHEFSAKFTTYLSPRSLFFTPDPDPQRSIPEISVFYPWMVIFYLAGLLGLVTLKNKKAKKLLILLILITLIPASLTKDPFSTHRAIAFLLPLTLIFGMGIDKIARKLKLRQIALVLAIITPISLLLLWRSYFILLAKERAIYWNYGYEKLAEEIRKRPESHFIIDTSRIKPPYAALAFFLKVNPKKFQESIPKDILNQYYQNPPFDNHFKFLNLETRPIFWQEDIYEKQILVGDALAISDNQAQEHFLTKIFEIKDPVEDTIFVAYETNPQLKCSSISYRNKGCVKYNH